MIDRQSAAVGYPQLFAHQINAAYFLADGMFHLQSRIDFQEVHPALFGHHEFASAQSHVIDRFEQTARITFQHADRIVREERRGSLLDQFLIAALDGAVARGVHGEVAVRIASALRFDMTSLVDESFHEVFVEVPALQRIVAHMEPAQFVIVAHQRDASAATAVGALEHQRIAVRMREIEQ